MKNQKTAITGLAEGFFWSMFIGVVGISIGLGALYPPLNFVAKPFVCPDGQLTFEKQVDSPTPSQTFLSADWYCTRAGSPSGRQPVSPFAYAGVFYGLLCFPVYLLGRTYFKKREAAQEGISAKGQKPGGFPLP